MKSIVLIGQIACGKGTQSKLLQERLGMYPIGMGDILRDHKKRGTDIGKMATELDKEGKLMPNDIIIGLMKEEILKNKDKVSGFIFDGAVRTLEQAVALDEMLHQVGIAYDVVNLYIDDERAVRRALHRGKTSGRVEDSNETVVRKRIAVYHENTTPCLEWYESQNRLSSFDAMAHVEIIYNKIKTLLEYDTDLFGTYIERPRRFRLLRNKLFSFGKYIKKNMFFIYTLLSIIVSGLIRSHYGWEWGLFSLLTFYSLLDWFRFILIDSINKWFYPLFTMLVPIIIGLSTEPIYGAYYYVFFILSTHAYQAESEFKDKNNE